MTVRRRGPYRLETLRGRGGMGEVLRAVDTAHGDRVVALNLPGSWLNRSDEYVRRFRRESAVVAGLGSRYGVPIHTYGEIDGQLLVDTQFVPGTDLAPVIRRDGPLTARRAVGIVEQVAHALDTAHRAGLVHRDVKPSNVLLAECPGRRPRRRRRRRRRRHGPGPPDRLRHRPADRGHPAVGHRARCWARWPTGPRSASSARTTTAAASTPWAACSTRR